MDNENNLFDIENEEADLVVLEDDDGNEITMEVMDYVFYEGKEYAFLAEYVKDRDEEAAIDGVIMEVCPVEGDDELEEFVPIEESLAETLLELFRNGGYAEDMLEDEE
ncbi:MAG: DUF1292 domain-containing protein [Clostridia bacterium]|nr:DUF1292 domain-containing protein [Clostridia bacterium]